MKELYKVNIINFNSGIILSKEYDDLVKAKRAYNLYVTKAKAGRLKTSAPIHTIELLEGKNLISQMGKFDAGELIIPGRIVDNKQDSAPDRNILEDYPEKDLSELTGFKKELQKQIAEISALFGSLGEVEQKYLGADMIDTLAKVSRISRQMLSREPAKLNNEVVYSFERFNIKEMLDMQFMLAGYHGYVSSILARLKATAILKKSYLEIAFTYVYQTVYDHIQDSHDRKPTIPEIEGVIKSELKEQYSVQRISAALSVLLESVLTSVEFMRNVLNSTINYLREDSINSLHAAKSGL